MKKYYKKILGSTGYKVNKNCHGLAISIYNTKCYYINCKNKTIFYYSNIISKKPILTV